MIKLSHFHEKGKIDILLHDKFHDLSGMGCNNIPFFLHFQAPIAESPDADPAAESVPLFAESGCGSRSNGGGVVHEEEEDGRC